MSIVRSCVKSVIKPVVRSLTGLVIGSGPSNPKLLLEDGLSYLLLEDGTSRLELG
jgi:hypothetical protein